MAGPQAVLAETIEGAMAKAYRNNSELNKARAGVRVTDEGVAIAKSGYRPTIGAQGTIDYTKQSGTSLATGSFGVAIQQSIFDGFQTRNNVRAAESQVRAANEGLRNVEQNILQTAVGAYMDVIRDRRIATLTEQNLEFLTEQVRAARSRFEVGEGTRTDVAQAEASQAAAVAQVSAARAQAAVSAALYRQVVGEEPGSLQGAGPVRAALPSNFEQAFAIALTEHPAIKANLHLVDAAAFSVKSAEGAMLPQVNAEAGVSTSFRETYSDLPGVGAQDGTTESFNIGATLTVPIYQGGRASAQVRQRKESLGEARIDVDVTRDQVRQALSAAWSQYRAAQESVEADRLVVNAAQLALNGVIEERNVGQRTTLDVLNAQADVIQAQVQLAQDERDVVVASYAILSAAGRLSVSRLGLAVERYDPGEHYRAVKDKWYGTKTPDAR
ncbi:MAG: TolC family outer membrane protein [Rhizobiaceae bacterium]|nr:TolC family outer membrane protein [Rhizobiaceae bacterium]MCV0409079.1 TolC family outer membrane protein [Rhizobiaceae bacterium]